jgi:hypothetical protein
MKTKHPSYCCQKCGELIGWIGRVLPFHKCKEKNMNSLPRYNEKAELDTRLRVDPLTGDVGIGTPKLEKKDEPIAWGMEKDGLILDVICPAEHEREEGEYTIPLYTTPQRTWVGLTDEDMDFLFPHGKSVWVQEMVKIIENKLKEKNT